jgi:3-phosphoinositide dependent protein kinase-1
VGSPAKTSVATSASKSIEKPKRARPEEFVFGKLIGEGSYSCVFLAKEVSSQREFAIKVCEKRQIIQENKSEYIHREKEIMLLLSDFNEKRPYFVQLHSTFQVSLQSSNKRHLKTKLSRYSDFR